MPSSRCSWEKRALWYWTFVRLLSHSHLCSSRLPTEMTICFQYTDTIHCISALQQLDNLIYKSPLWSAFVTELFACWHYTHKVLSWTYYHSLGIPHLCSFGIVWPENFSVSDEVILDSEQSNSISCLRLSFIRPLHDPTRAASTFVCKKWQQ